MMKEEKIFESYKKWKEAYSDEFNCVEFKSHVKVMLNTFEYVLGFNKDAWTK